MDHFVPQKFGGTHSLDNLVPACGGCNSSKSDRAVEDARHGLLLKAIGWPRFSIEQLTWLRSQGFDLSAYDNGKLWFEAAMRGAGR